METDDELRRYLPAPFEGRRALTALFPSLDGWPRSTRKAPDNMSGVFGVSRCYPFKTSRRRRKNWNAASRI